MLKDAELNSLPNGRHKDCKRHPHLYFYVRGGSRTWLMRYRIRGSSVTDLSLGSYPSISLKEARLEAARHNLQRNSETFPSPLTEPLHQDQAHNLDKLHLQFDCRLGMSGPLAFDLETHAILSLGV